MSLADMSSLLANATPGQAVTVFVGSGQRLGLVGGVVYEHPIAVTALPAAGVAAQPALLAVAALNRSSAADGGGVAAPLAASDLAAGFPALEIRVDPADRCATAFARAAWARAALTCTRLPPARTRARAADARTVTHRYKPLEITLSPAAAGRRLLAAPASCRLNRIAGTRGAACNCPAVDCSQAVGCRTNRNGTAAVDNGGVWIV